jgi:hypothetical protein
MLIKERARKGGYALLERGERLLEPTLGDGRGVARSVSIGLGGAIVVRLVVLVVVSADADTSVRVVAADDVRGGIAGGDSTSWSVSSGRIGGFHLQTHLHSVWLPIT